MAIEKLDEMPEIKKGVRTIFRELVDAVKDAADGEVLKFVRDDDKKVNATTIRVMLEKSTGRDVKVIKYSNDTAIVQLLNSDDAKAEKEERKKRAAEMKTKLKGK